MYYEYTNSNGWPWINCKNIVTSDKKSPTQIMHYRYTVKYIFEKSEDLINAAKWAEDTCIGPWLIGCNTSGFLRQEDAIHFKLRYL